MSDDYTIVVRFELRQASREQALNIANTVRSYGETLAGVQMFEVRVAEGTDLQTVDEFLGGSD